MSLAGLGLGAASLIAPAVQAQSAPPPPLPTYIPILTSTPLPRPTIIAHVPILGVSLSQSPTSSVTFGGWLDETLTVSNSGSAAATNASVSLHASAGAWNLVYAIVSSGGGFSCASTSGSDISCSGGSVPIGGHTTIVLRLQPVGTLSTSPYTAQLTATAGYASATQSVQVGPGGLGLYINAPSTLVHGVADSFEFVLQNASAYALTNVDLEITSDKSMFTTGQTTSGFSCWNANSGGAAIQLWCVGGTVPAASGGWPGETDVWFQLGSNTPGSLTVTAVEDPNQHLGANGRANASESWPVTVQ